MSGIYGIHHICICTPDIEKSVAFYRDIMGFGLIGRETCDFGEYAMMKLNDSRLELIQPNEQNEDTFGNKGSITHIGLAVEGIDSVWDDLRAKGVPLLSDSIEDDDAPMGGLRVIQLLGPSQEHINLYEWKRTF
ncbi:MAG: VOC family protein [Synergistaceae bacterium]|nr:VOC family protein [Synergistaceae bacterium]